MADDASQAGPGEPGILQSVLESLLEPYVRLMAVRDESGEIADFEFVDANRAACSYNRRSRGDLLGRRLLELLPGHGPTGLLRSFAEVVETGQPFTRDDLSYDNELIGGIRRTDLRCVRTGDGVSLVWRDVTEERAAYEALAASEERFRLLAENASDVVLHLRDGGIVWASPSIQRVLGWSPVEMTGRRLRSLAHPHDVDHVLESPGPDTPPQRCRIRLVGSEGTYHWFDANSGPLVRPDGKPDGQVATFRMIDAEIAAEQELERRARYDELTGLLSRAEIFGRISTVGHDGRRTGEQSAVLFCDIDKFKGINDGFGHAAGDEVLRVIAQRLRSCVRSNDVVARIGGDELLVLLTGVRGLDDAIAVAEKIRTNAAYPIPVDSHYISATLSIGVALAVPGEGVDPLIARADTAMFRAKQAGRDQVIAIPRPVAPSRVLVVDDDDFMLDVAEELLRRLGQEDVVRAVDGVTALNVIDDAQARPDVVMCDINMTGMDGIELLRHLAERDFRGSVIVMSGSGDGLLASVADLAVMHGLHLAGALRKPLVVEDLARAVDATRPPSQEPAIEQVKGVRIGSLTAEEVRDGIDAGCVDVHVQPKVSVAGRRVLGAEALLRWRDPVRGMLSPAAIVPVAEAHGMIQDLTIAVYSRAVAALAGWRAEGLDLKVAVNLSADNLAWLELPDELARIAREAGIPTSHIVLEITEERLMDRLATSLEVIGRLRLKGFGISIDDYGMGYSNMRKLRQLPITELKVDRSFVTTAHRDSVLRVILSSSIALGHSLGLSVVGEGVETQEAWELLHELGCDEAQGYFIARPMPAADLPAWMRVWEATWS